MRFRFKWIIYTFFAYACYWTAQNIFHDSTYNEKYEAEIQKRINLYKSSCPTSNQEKLEFDDLKIALNFYQVEKYYKIAGCIAQGIRPGLDWSLLFHRIRQAKRIELGYQPENFMDANLASKEDSSYVTELDKYFKFLIVQHPFGRLYSSWKYQFRNQTFPDFLESFSVTIESKIFENIDDFLLPVENICKICWIPLDIIMRLEDFEENTHQFGYKLRKKLDTKLFGKIYSTLNHANTKPDWDFRFLEEKYRDIDKNILEQVASYYQKDMDYFGYYFDLAGKRLGKT